MTKEQKMAFVQRCYDDVIEDLITTEEEWGNEPPTSFSTGEIIRDYKSEAIEYEYMTEEEFDELYAECDRIAIMKAMAYC